MQSLIDEIRRMAAITEIEIDGIIVQVDQNIDWTHWYDNSPFGFDDVRRLNEQISQIKYARYLLTQVEENMPNYTYKTKGILTIAGSNTVIDIHKASLRELEIIIAFTRIISITYDNKLQKFLDDAIHVYELLLKKNELLVYLWKKKDEKLNSLINTKVYKKKHFAEADLEKYIIWSKRKANDYEVVTYALVRKDS